jgi:hypothetical protein
MRACSVRIFLCLILTVAGGSVALAQAPAWTEAGNPAGRYGILMPGIPTPGSVPIPLPGNRQSTMFTSTLRTPNQLFFASYVDYPSDIFSGVSTDAFLMRVRGGHLKGRRLISERGIRVGGHPGRELIAETPQGVVLVIRSVFVAPRLYQYIVEGRPGVEHDPDTWRYLDSFVLH